MSIVSSSLRLTLYVAVDKVIIAQEPLKALINSLSPGAYTSLTKVDFAALDALKVKPLGIYGSKQEIVRMLFSVGCIDDEMCVSYHNPY